MPAWKDPEVAAMGEMFAAMRPPPGAPAPTWPERRAQFDAMGSAAPLPEGTKVEPITLGGVPAERLTPSNAQAGRSIFWLHGGGYCIGSCAGYRGWAARMAEGAAATAVTVDYRLAPEHRFPAAVDDALAAWRAFLAEGHDPKRTVIGGDSAGGGLTMSTGVAARDAGLALPAGLHLVSPWANLTNASPAYAAKGETDFLITQAGIDDFKANYLPPGHDHTTPLASPVFADLAGLPPILIQVGSEEVLMSDSIQLAERAGLAEVDVTLRIFPHMIHIWPFFAQLGASGRAIAESSAWVKARTA